jgi:SulP family sulfate permease
MSIVGQTRGGQSSPTFAQLYTPKLVTVLREGYRLPDLKADIVSGLTVAIVALPLSMAIAISSGATPDRGLYTAVVGGMILGLLGGSRFQIGGPAGAFIVLVASCVAREGIDGLLLATFMAGFFLLGMGFLRLGTYIKFIPYPVTVGFTAGIAVIIAASEIRDFMGLTLTVPEPGAVIPRLITLGAAFPTTNPAARALGVGTLALIFGLKKWKPTWPGMLIAVATAATIAVAFQLPVETIGTRFGGIPRSLPAPHLPDLTFAKMQAVLPDAFAFALLGAIESLLSAVVADGMTGRRHRSNCELVAQGVANIGSSIFGGICVTGTIARTATNIRAGARSPVSCILHSSFVLLFILVAAPLASYIPLSALAGVLIAVCWTMAEKHEFAVLLRSKGDAAVLLATFLITIFRDLTTGIICGFALGALLFIHRMASSAGRIEHVPPVPEDRADDANGARTAYDPALATDPDVVVYRLSGAFFFGAAATIGTVLDRIADQYKTLIIDFSAVPFLDSTAARTVAGILKKVERRGARMIVTGAAPSVRHELRTHGVTSAAVRFFPSIERALAARREKETATS